MAKRFLFAILISTSTTIEDKPNHEVLYACNEHDGPEGGPKLADTPDSSCGIDVRPGKYV